MYKKFILAIMFLFPILRAANAATVIYESRAEFLGNVSASMTDDYTGYALGRYTDEDMSAVFGQATYETLSFLDLNLVGHVFGRDDGSSYCAGCNGNFRLGFESTSLSQNGGIFGVGLDIVLHTSRRVSIGDDDPSNPTYPGVVGIQFTDGAIQEIMIPPDIGYYEASVYFLGITDERGITSLTVGAAPSERHFWVIDNLTIAAGGPEPISSVPEPATMILYGLGFGAAGVWRKLRKR